MCHLKLQVRGLVPGTAPHTSAKARLLIPVGVKDPTNFRDGMMTAVMALYSGMDEVDKPGP